MGVAAIGAVQKCPQPNWNRMCDNLHHLDVACCLANKVANQNQINTLNI